MVTCPCCGLLDCCINIFLLKRKLLVSVLHQSCRMLCLSQGTSVMKHEDVFRALTHFQPCWQGDQHGVNSNTWTVVAIFQNAFSIYTLMPEVSLIRVQFLA